MALTELNVDDKIFTHQYIVVGFRPEFKVSKHISLPVMVGIHAVRNAYYDGRSWRFLHYIVQHQFHYGNGWADGFDRVEC